MVGASEYREKNSKLMNEYEESVRSWLIEKGRGDFSRIVPFFRDGVTCPEKWFQAHNDFRPLFILKEVSLGFNFTSDIDSYIKKWGNRTRFEFVGNPFDDVKIGKFRTWIRIARLAKGLEEITNGNDECDYYKYDFSYSPGEEKYCGDIEGYRVGSDGVRRTANTTYKDIIERIAVINVKKIGGGKNVNCELSNQSMHYFEHIEPFVKFLCSQIDLIDPTVIICCGRGIYDQLSIVRRNTAKRIWLNRYHPAMTSNKCFYEDTLTEYKHLFQQWHP